MQAKTVTPSPSTSTGKSKLPKNHYTRNITPKCVTSGGAHLARSELGQRSSEKSNGAEPLATVSDLTGPAIEPKTSRVDSDVSNHYSNSPVFAFL